MKIIILPGLEILAASLAEHLFSILTQLSKEKNNINIALSGGNTPGILFRELAQNYSEKINWPQIHIYWVDERCVPPDHPESNYGMAKKTFIEFLSIPPENVNRIRGEEQPSAEAKRYSEQVMLSLPQKNKIPAFDVILLGIGEDGHTASIFPDQMQLINASEVYSSSVHPSTKQSRVTMTGRVINNSDFVFVLVSGNSKAKVVSSILNKDAEAVVYPANYINPVSSNLFWYLDEEAAKYLDAEK